MFNVGDLNGIAGHFKTITALTQNRGWTDVGSVASRLGEEDEQQTCKAPAAKTEAGRDCEVVNASAYPPIKGSSRTKCDEFPVYRVLQVLLEADETIAEQKVNATLPSLADLADKHIIENCKRLQVEEGSAEEV